jgi:ATP-dependent helicase/nuclease subunit B
MRVEAPGEDVQLTGYALLQEGVAEAAFISLDKPAPKTVALPDDPQALAAAERDRLASLFQRLRAGARLTAHGDDGTCTWCEMQPLCRKAYWVEKGGER